MGRLDYPARAIHGDADTRIPVSHGSRVAEAGALGTALWRVSWADLVDAFESSPNENVERVAKYLDARLK